MKGLLYKDFISLANYAPFLGLMLALLLVISYMTEGSMVFAPVMLTTCVMMLSTTLFSFDDTSNWNRFAIALPISRKTLVGSRYLFGLLSLVVGCALGMLAGAAVAAVKGETGSFSALVGAAAATAGVGLLFDSLTFPIAYKFGAEKSRYLTIGLFLGFVLLVSLLPGEVLDSFFLFIGAHIASVLATSAALILALFGLSFWASCKIVGNKEF